MNHQTKLKGVCPIKLQFDLDENIVTNVKFTGGCNGNLKSIAKLVDGMSADEIEDKLAGITCGANPTSCSDQLVIAIRKAREKQK